MVSKNNLIYSFFRIIKFKMNVLFIKICFFLRNSLQEQNVKINFANY